MQRPEIIVEDLLEWYKEHRRVLPWREDPTPYHVWLSEIMLQQTRVEAVKAYYARFLETLPSIEALADATEETILKLWEGLGYYNRVRNMQAAARTIVSEMQGEFPDTYHKIITLKGIGEYTAGAIASIAFQEAVPAVDGNVLRVYSRLTGSEADIGEVATKRYITEEIRAILPIDRPGQFNQALMDLGAMVCIPNGAPRCKECPWQAYCISHLENRTDSIPVKQTKTKRRKENKTVFLLFAEGKVAITKREAKGLLAGMWQFPMADSTLSLEESRNMADAFVDTSKECKDMKDSFMRIREGSRRMADTLVCIPDKELDKQSSDKNKGDSSENENENVNIKLAAGAKAKHIFSHIEWQMSARVITLERIPENTTFMNQQITWVSKEELQYDYAMPSAFAVYREKVLEKLK